MIDLHQKDKDIEYSDSLMVGGLYVPDEIYMYSPLIFSAPCTFELYLDKCSFKFRVVVAFSIPDI